MAVEIRPYFDSRWLKVQVGGDQLFVSKRAYGAVVRRLAGEDDRVDDPGEGGDASPGGVGGES